MTTHAKDTHGLVTDDAPSNWAGGLVTFAGVMLVVAGVWHALAGIAALFNDDLYISTPDYVYALDLTGWGWGHLVLGLLVVATGGAILNGRTWGRIAGMVLVVLSLIANFVFIPWYPVWSLVIIGLDVAVIWALAAWRPKGGV
ncbi:DUF7144 family membrane protein [Actinophytocola sp. KF-1]